MSSSEESIGKQAESGATEVGSPVPNSAYTMAEIEAFFPGQGPVAALAQMPEGTAVILSQEHADQLRAAIQEKRAANSGL